MKALLRKDGDRIVVKFEPVRSSEDAAYAKELASLVPHGRYRYARKEHAYPLSVGTCQEMRRQWGDMVTVHKELAAWYRVEAAAAKNQVTLARAGNATLEVVPQAYPALYAALGSWQRVAAKWIASAYRNGGLLVDEPGIGKTRSVIAGLLERGSNHILILCPKLSVKTVWGREWRNLAPDVPVYLARGTRATRTRVMERYFADPAPRKVLVTVAETIRIKGKRAKASQPYQFLGYEYPQLFVRSGQPVPWDAVVVDESHTLLGSLTIKKGNLAGEGLRLLPVEAEHGLKLCVTGTPWGRGGRVEGMFGALHWCWPDEYPSYWGWAKRYFDVQSVLVRRGNPRQGTSDIYANKVGGLIKDSEQSFYDDLGPRLLRRTMEDVKPGRLKPSYWDLYCEMEPSQARQYAALAADAEVKVQGGIVSTTGVLDYLTRARQMANGEVAMREDGSVYFTGVSAKIDVLMWELEQRGIMDDVGTGKVVVASQWVEFLQAISDRLSSAGVPHYMLTGKTSQTLKDAIQDHWQRPNTPNVNPERVLLLSIRAGGLSINLDAADELFQCDRVFPPEAEEQLHRRIRRMSRDHKTSIYFLQSEGTIDERTAGALFEKLMEQLRVLDGRRGKEFARKIAKYTPSKE